MLSALRGFIDHFFKCHYCRRHFLRQYEEGSYGRQLAEESYEDTGPNWTGDAGLI